MAGGKVETDPVKLAEHCENFMKGAKRLYDGERIKAMKGDMWLFELYHTLNDCAAALRKQSGAVKPPPPAPPPTRTIRETIFP